MVTEIMPGVFWVGVVDWGIKSFHGHEYSTHRGTTYRARPLHLTKNNPMFPAPLVRPVQADR